MNLLSKNDCLLFRGKAQKILNQAVDAKLCETPGAEDLIQSCLEKLYSLLTGQEFPYETSKEAELVRPENETDLNTIHDLLEARNLDIIKPPFKGAQHFKEPRKCAICERLWEISPDFYSEPPVLSRGSYVTFFNGRRIMRAAQVCLSHAKVLSKLYGEQHSPKRNGSSKGKRY